MQSEWNETILQLLCFGYVRNNLTNIRIDDIAQLISSYVADFKLRYILNEKYCEAYFKPQLQSNQVDKCDLNTYQPKLNSSSNTIICKFNNYIAGSSHEYSSIFIAPFISQLKPHTTHLSQKSEVKNKNEIIFSVKLTTIDSGHEWFSTGGYQFEIGLFCMVKNINDKFKQHKLDRYKASKSNENNDNKNKNNNNNNENNKAKQGNMSVDEETKNGYNQEKNGIDESNDILDYFQDIVENVDPKDNYCRFDTVVGLFKMQKSRISIAHDNFGYICYSLSYFSDLKENGYTSAVNVTVGDKKDHSYCSGLGVRLKQGDEIRLHVDLQGANNVQSKVYAEKYDSLNKCTLIGKNEPGEGCFTNGFVRVDLSKYYLLFAICSARQGMQNMGDRKGFVFQVKLLQ